MTLPTPQLTTDRLILQPLELTDVPAIQQLFPQWEIVRYMSAHVPWPYPADGALTFVRDHALKDMSQGKGWYWSIRPQKRSEELIGVINLTDTEDDNRGFWLAPAWQGQGLMSEACEAVTTFWFEELQRPVLRAPKAAPNGASKRLSAKQNMRLLRTEMRAYVAGTFPGEIWEITREEWLRQKSDKL